MPSTAQDSSPRAALDLTPAGRAATSLHDHVLCRAAELLGTLTLTATAAGLSGVYLPGHRHGPPSRAEWVHDPDRLADAGTQLEQYLAGARSAFDLELAPPLGTPFQRRVWAALETIAYGETTSYGVLAAWVGAPAAVRAVGAANGRNPLSIVRPCHRVVGADGSLTGYGGGVAAKRALLALEAGVASLWV